MQFRESHAAGILRGEVAHDHMLLERNFAVGAFLLLEPGKSPPVGLKTGHDIIEAVAIDVIHGHLAATRAGPIPAAEIFRMVSPWSLNTLGRLFPPPVCIDEVHPAVAIDVS